MAKDTAALKANYQSLIKVSNSKESEVRNMRAESIKTYIST